MSDNPPTLSPRSDANPPHMGMCACVCGGEITTAQAAERLGVSTGQVLYAIKTGHFPGARRGPQPGRGGWCLWLPVSEVEQYRAIVNMPIGERKTAARERNRGQLRYCPRCEMVIDGEPGPNGLCPFCADEVNGRRAHWYPVSQLRSIETGSVRLWPAQGLT